MNDIRHQRLRSELPRLAADLRSAVVTFIKDCSDIPFDEMTPVAMALEGLDGLCSPVAKIWIARAVAHEQGRRQAAGEVAR